MSQADRPGKAWQGWAWLGWVWLGGVRQGVDDQHAKHSQDRLGEAGPGRARQG